MKKQLIALMLIISSVAATSAFATRARESVMGTGDAFGVLSAGSFFADDERNIFFNPSYVNNYKNFAVIEKAGNGGGKAEGGFFTSMMNFNFGAYMNRAGAIDGATYFTTTNLRPIELFVGSDMGVKWGLGASFANKSVSATGTTDANDEKIADTTIRAGVQVMDFEPFAAFKVQGSDKHATAAVKNSIEDKNSGFTVGTKYHYGEWSPFAYFAKKTYTEADRTTDSPAMGSKAGFTAKGGKVEKSYMGIGFGRTLKASENVRMNYALSYNRGSQKDSSAADGAKATEAKMTIVPVDLSFDADATSWLVLRAGLSYKLYNRKSFGGANAGSQADDTTGRVGATAKFGKVDLDWAFGNAAVGDAENVDSATVGFDKGFFTQAALTLHM